jgi:hypothetical protein
MAYENEGGLTWASEVISATRPAGEPITGDNEEVIVKTLVGFRKTVDQFHVYLFGSEMATGCRFGAKTGIGINM